MTRFSSSRHGPAGSPLAGLYRDRENGWIFGVCAGIAERFGLDPLFVRIVAAVCLIFLFIPTAVLYLAAAALLRERPLTYCGSRCEHDFWRRHGSHDHWSAS